MEKIADIIVQNIMEIRHVEHEQKEILKFGIQIFMEMGINLIVSIGIMLVMVAVVLEINHNNIYLNIMISGLLLTAITLIMGKVKYRQYKT